MKHMPLIFTWNQQIFGQSNTFFLTLYIFFFSMPNFLKVIFHEKFLQNIDCIPKNIHTYVYICLDYISLSLSYT